MRADRDGKAEVRPNSAVAFLTESGSFSIDLVTAHAFGCLAIALYDGRLDAAISVPSSVSVQGIRRRIATTEVGCKR